MVASSTLSVVADTRTSTDSVAAIKSSNPLRGHPAKRRSGWNATGSWHRVANDPLSYPEDPSFAGAVSHFLKKEGAASAIDVGSGSGDIARAVAANAGIYVLGVDGNPHTTTGNLEHFEGGGQAEFRRLDLIQPFPRDFQRFDWAMSFAVAEHVPFQYEHVFLGNLHRVSRAGLLLVWDDRSSTGTGHVNSRDESEVLRIFETLGYSLDTAASAEIRRNAQQRWYKLVLVLRHSTPNPDTSGDLESTMDTVESTARQAAIKIGRVCPPFGTAAQDCWFDLKKRYRHLAEFLMQEHQRACWPPQWEIIQEACCSQGSVIAPQVDLAAASCFGTGFYYQVCCATIKDYYIF